ncbi:MAG: hypothetical protein RMX68_030215 [Aulosira sp. ZfuVER01]|nr:hypothetical protein [Aulosira sp. ZfuVER01]MDZ7997734.1 hypothetical protein [Aulosira sp. DedVER01a]MDZ8052229.1 hypothetical protein [Aulosira sp. ZfuCHP01]
MLHTLERPRTLVKSTYTPPNPKPLLPDLDPPSKTTQTEEVSEPSETETSQPSETEESSASE